MDSQTHYLRLTLAFVIATIVLWVFSTTWIRTPSNDWFERGELKTVITDFFQAYAEKDASKVYDLMVPVEDGGETSLQEIESGLQLFNLSLHNITVTNIYFRPLTLGREVRVSTQVTYSTMVEQWYTVELHLIGGMWKVYAAYPIITRG